jgi:hypothetical protein
MPTDINELIWYGFGLLATYFLWSINDRLKKLGADLALESTHRIALAMEVAKIKATCAERHKGDDHG